MTRKWKPGVPKSWKGKDKSKHGTVESQRGKELYQRTWNHSAEGASIKFETKRVPCFLPPIVTVNDKWCHLNLLSRLPETLHRPQPPTFFSISLYLLLYISCSCKRNSWRKWKKWKGMPKCDLNSVLCFTQAVGWDQTKSVALLVDWKSSLLRNNLLKTVNPNLKL